MKVADFGVARFQNQEGIMTAETGTYRWMAPEVSFLCVYRGFLFAISLQVKTEKQAQFNVLFLVSLNCLVFEF